MKWYETAGLLVLLVASAYGIVWSVYAWTMTLAATHPNANNVNMLAATAICGMIGFGSWIVHAFIIVVLAQEPTTKTKKK